MRLLSLLALAALGLSLPTTTLADDGAPEPFRCSWQDIAVLDGKALPAEGVSLERPWLNLRFDEGTFYGLEACGRLVGLAWQGHGEVDILDAGPEYSHVIRDRLVDLPGTATLEGVVLLAGDGAVEELIAAAGEWQDAPVPVAARSMVGGRVIDWEPGQGKSGHAPGEMLYAPDPGMGGLLIDLKTSGIKRARKDVLAGKLPIKWLSYQWSWPSGMRTGYFGGLGIRAAGIDIAETLAALPRPSGGVPAAYANGGKRFDLSDAEIDVKFEQTTGLDRDLAEVTVRATLHFEALEGAPQFLALTLVEGRRRTQGQQWGPVRIHGVHVGEESVDFDRVADRLFVHLPAPPADGSSVDVDVYYSGALVEPAGQTAITPLTSSWYPWHWSRDRHTLTTTAQFPKFWKVAATGKVLEELQEGTTMTVTSRTERPVENGAVFIVDARLQVTASPGPGLPVVRILRSPDTQGVATKFADEVHQHIEFLNGLLGPFPYEELEIVERKVAGGYAGTPGVIAVPIFDTPPNVVLTTNVGRHSLLQAIVRQYLVTDMGPASYRESWIIEGLAMLAECYALDAAGHPGSCVANLKGMRTVWMDHLAGSGDAWLIGPLSQGTWAGVPAVGSFGNPNSQLRGPLVMHRLRMLIGEGPTQALVRQVARSYRGQRLRSESFEKQAHTFAGADLSDFFDAWVRATPQQPVARVTWRTVEEADGTFTLHLNGHVDAGRTGDPLPILAPALVGIKYGKDKAWQRIVLTEQPVDMQIRGIPAAVKKIELDHRTWPGKVDVKKHKE